MKVTRYTERKRTEDLTRAVAVFLTMMDDVPVKEIAKKSKLSMGTIYRYRKNPPSLAIHFGTVQALAAVCGVRIDMAQSKVRFQLV